LHIALVSGGNGWHVRDLQRAAAEQGHSTTIVDFRLLSAAVAAPGDCLAGFDTAVVRSMPAGSLEQVIFRMDALQAAAAGGVRVLNSPRALEICIDKFLTGKRLEKAGVPVPPTVACQSTGTAMAAFAALGGDVVVKPLFGAEGRGIVRITDEDVAWRTFRALEMTQSVLYLQQFVPHPGWDLRVFVLNGRACAAMRRHARDGWRTNIARGATGRPVELTTEEEGLAVRAAGAVGACAAGVDLLPAPDGSWYVLEVNAVPGWRTLTAVTGVDVAAGLVRYLTNETVS
jgi:ribosomal protein S6--L-glutamate ligase